MRDQPGARCQPSAPLARHGLGMDRLESWSMPAGAWQYGLLGAGEGNVGEASLRDAQAHASVFASRAGLRGPDPAARA
jgi:hypothetical protein